MCNTLSAHILTLYACQKSGQNSVTPFNTWAVLSFYSAYTILPLQERPNNRLDAGNWAASVSRPINGLHGLLLDEIDDRFFALLAVGLLYDKPLGSRVASVSVASLRCSCYRSIALASQVKAPSHDAGAMSYGARHDTMTILLCNMPTKLRLYQSDVRPIFTAGGRTPL